MWTAIAAVVGGVLIVAAVAAFITLFAFIAWMNSGSH